jgi:hypothetical protein
MSFRTLTRLLHFCADRIEQSEKPGLLAQTPAQSQKTLNGKLVANFLCFPTVIYTPLYDQRYRSYDHCNLRGAAGNQLWADQAIWISLDFKATSKGIWKNSKYEDPIKFYNLFNEG